MENKYDVIIVGGGPAGQAVAFELAEITSLSILLIEQGMPIAERKCSSLENLCLDHANCSITQGSGGAGLFSDGKLCLDPNVGGDITRFYSATESLELMKRVTEMLSLDGNAICATQPAKKDISACIQAFTKTGLNFEYYDVTRLSLNARMKKVEALEKYLEKQMDLLFNTKVMEISPNGEYLVKTSKGEYHCKYIVLAAGKVGSNWLSEQCNKLGVRAYNNPLYLGVRLELPRKVTTQISDLTENPKISMNFSNGDRIKTHCFSDKGQVAIADYGGMKLVEGTYLDTRESENASVNIVMQLNLPEFVDPYVFSSRFVQQINSFGKCRPIVQTLKSMYNLSETHPAELLHLPFQPTLTDCRAGDLSTLYSIRFADRLSRFIRTVDYVVPGFAQETNLLYAPFVEWWMKKVEVNKYFETCRPGLFVAGDGAGMSQGIIAAGMQGIACARGIAEASKKKM